MPGAIQLGSPAQALHSSALHQRQLVVKHLIVTLDSLCALSASIALLQVLRDAGRRSSYDALRSGYGGFEGSSSSGAYEANWEAWHRQL